MADFFYTLLVPNYLKRNFMVREFASWEELHNAWLNEDQGQMVVGWSENGKIEERFPTTDKDGQWYIWYKAQAPP